MAPEPGFQKAQSDNLPKVDSMSMISFLANHPDFMGAEIRGVKLKRSGRESYGDNAIGFVQVKRDGNVCTVKAKVSPEHNVRKRPYAVTVVCHESEEEIQSVECEDCAASSGGCKHAIALLTWLHRRSEEPPPTSTVCYWKKSTLSCVGTTLRFVKAADIGKKERKEIKTVKESEKAAFLCSVENAAKKGGMKTVLRSYWDIKSNTEKLSIHYLMQEFFSLGIGDTAQDFMTFLCKIDETLCQVALHETNGQNENPLWRELRYGRITASKIYEAVHCKTDGVLVERILGAYVFKDTPAMKRGVTLEHSVRKVVEKQMGCKLKVCGLVIDHKNPIIGASADGINEDFVLEIKCPTKEKTVINYVSDNKVKEKYFAQLQLQMFLHKKSKGIFCVADPKFELNKSIQIYIVDLDEGYCNDLIKKSVEFWCKFIFPKLKSNFV